MSTSFPVAIDTLTNPAATDGLAGHAQQHANANDAIEALQAKVGVTGSANPESIDYRVASVESGKVDKAAGKQLSTEDYSTVEKQKLAGIEAGANAYTHPATHSAAMVDTDSTHRFVTDTQAAAWDSKAAGSHVGSGGTAHAAVTTSVDGFMSAPDKVKLNAISGTNTGDETATTIKAKLGIATLSGVNTGDQTSVTGNAGTATKLQTARTINGVSFDGGANITINAVDSTARIASSEKGAANGVAPLGADLKIAATYLPSYVDDVLEYANQAAFPASGETGKIYVALDSNKPFRWSGSAYVEISASPGSTDAVTEGASNLYFTAQRVRDAVLTGLSTATNAVISATDSVLVAFGKLQKQISDHLANPSNPHGVTKAQVGLSNADNTSDAAKPISAATQTALALKADLVSPAFTTPDIGVATGTSFNSITGLSSTTPVMDGTAAVGTGVTVARADHVHPTDTSRAPIASPSFTGTLTHSGDVVLSGSGKRITGDFSNATVANRAMFQSNVVNGASGVLVAPNGTSATAVYGVVNASDPTNAAVGELRINPAEVRLASGVYGGGGYLPMTFHTGGAERVRIDPSGNVHVGFKGSAGTLLLNATDSTFEGGELLFGGASSYSDWVVDSYGADLRVRTPGAGSFLVITPNGLGYGPGAGGTVTQATSKSTVVTLNKPCGKITMNAASLAAGASVQFPMQNSLVTANDVLVLGLEAVNIDATADYLLSHSCSTGIAYIVLTNRSSAPLAQAVVVNFAIIKGATS